MQTYPKCHLPIQIKINRFFTVPIGWMKKWPKYFMSTSSGKSAMSPEIFLDIFKLKVEIYRKDSKPNFRKLLKMKAGYYLELLTHGIMKKNACKH